MAAAIAFRNRLQSGSLQISSTEKEGDASTEADAAAAADEVRRFAKSCDHLMMCSALHQTGFGPDRFRCRPATASHLP
jgi:hypothetical protein